MSHRILISFLAFVFATGASGHAGSVECVGLAVGDDNNAAAAKTDEEAADLRSIGGHAYEKATGANQVGGDIELTGGVGTRQVTIDDYTQCSGAIVTVTIDGSANVLTEGSEWTAATDNNTTAISLAAAVNGLTGVLVAVPPAAIAYIEVEELTQTVDLAEDTPACTTLTQGTDGTVSVLGVLKVADEITFISVRHNDIPIGATTVGPTAPGNICNGSVCGKGFDADGEQVSLVVDIPSAWNGASDMTLRVSWTNQSGSAIPDTKKVIWDFDYRSVDPTSETVSEGTEVAGTVTYTQSGAGTDGEIFRSDITIPYATGNQPLAVSDNLIGILTRDVTGEAGDSYAGDALVYLVELIYQSDSAISSH
jgi:hypothetical protein